MDFLLKLARRFSAIHALFPFFTALITFSMSGCIASVPVVVNLIDSGRQYTATLDVSKGADEIYQIVVRELEKLPDVRIIRKDDAKFSVEASRAEKVTRITASSAGSGTSRVTVTADAGKSWEESRELASRVVRRICQEVNMQCQLIVK